MGRDLEYLIVLLLLLSCAVFESEAESSSKEMMIDDSLERFSLGAIEHSGPSPSGPGHRARSRQAEHFGQTSGSQHVQFSRFHH